MTILTRRDFVVASGAAGLALAAAAGGAAPRANAAVAGAYPQRDISFIIPYGPGGGFDNFARVVSPAIERYLPNPVNVIPRNVSGGGGGRGITQLFRARPDGYTIGILNIPGAFFLQERQGGRGFRVAEFTWLGTVSRGENYALAVGADSPLHSIADVQALSRQRPVKFTCTGPEGTAYSAAIISSELLGIDVQLITGYRSSSDYIVAAIRGDGDAVLATLSTLKPFMQSGTVRILASFESESSVPGIPDATALGQPELSQIVVERVVAAPPGVPDDIKNILVHALEQAVRDPEVIAWAEDAGIDWHPDPPGSVDGIIRNQAAFFEKWKSRISQS